MNILYYWLDYNTNMENWQRIHFFDELAKSGISIDVFNPLNYSSFEEANEVLIKKISNDGHLPDLFMTCVDDKFLYKETINIFKKRGIPTLLICFDNLHDPYMHRKIAPIFDLVWLTSFETVYLFKKWNCNTIFLPYAANPYQYSPQAKESISAVGFIGTLYGARLNKMQKLADNGINCHVFTNSNTPQSNNSQLDSNTFKTFINCLKFPIGRTVLKSAIINRFFTEKKIDRQNNIHFFPSVSFEDMISLYSAYSLSLGVTELRNTYLLKKPLHKLHLRTFEIPMCGGLQFTTFTEELAGYFEPDKEIIFYDNEDEMISKAKFYTNAKNEVIVKELKINAYHRAKSDHTWANRFKTIFKKLHLNQPFINYPID